MTLGTVKPIGRIETPWATTSDCPSNGRKLDPAPQCRVRLLPDYAPGLLGLDGFSHLILLYWMDRSRGEHIQFRPQFDGELRGVFATRSPRRPNPIALSVVAFDGFDGPDCLRVRNLDCMDGTPLLDIKPYLVSSDCEPDARMGWLEKHRTR